MPLIVILYRNTYEGRKGWMEPGTEPDFLLLQKIKNGKSDASEQLIKKYYSSIYQYCLLHTHDRNYAEDLTQETFLHFFAF